MSNDRFQSKYANTWLPTAGILPRNMKINGKEEEKGYIIKMSTLYGAEINPELCELLKEYISQKYGENKDIVEDIFSEKPRVKANTYSRLDDLEQYNGILEDANEIYLLLSGYFAEKRQVYISAKIGGGYWSQNEPFRNYVLQNIQTNIKIPSVENIRIALAAEIGENTDEVVEFLRNNHALFLFDKDIAKNPRKNSCSIDVKYACVSQAKKQKERTIAAAQRTLAAAAHLHS